MHKEIIVRFTCEGFHHWPDAPPQRAYLAHPHRHLFHVEVALEVTADNREVEFHNLLDLCRAQFPGGEMGAQSCEQMAGHLWAQVACAYPGRQISVSVFEDGEAGARVAGRSKPAASGRSPSSG